MQWWRISTFRSPFGGKLRFFEMFREDFFLEAYRVPPWLHKPVNLWSSSWYHHKNHSPKHTCSFSVVHKICFQLGERMIIHSAGSVEFIVLVIVLCRRRLASTCSFENNLWLGSRKGLKTFTFFLDPLILLSSLNLCLFWRWYLSVRLFISIRSLFEEKDSIALPVNDG